MTVDSSTAYGEHIGSGATTEGQSWGPTASAPDRITAIVVSGHTSFDRVLLEDAWNACSVHYVPQPGHVRGRAFLEVRLAFAGPGGATPPAASGLAALDDVVHTGDQGPGTVLALGVAARTPFLLTRSAADPSGFVIDIAHAEPGVGHQLLRLGDEGAAVRTWQWRLNLFQEGDLAVDGIFGAATETATYDFQGPTGLPTDGIVGPLTRATMAAALGL
jgi:hypothetical protein